MNRAKNDCPEKSAGKTLKTPARERGAALAIALVFLLLLTILGVTAVGTSTLQEKMAGNLRDQQVAFHSTESALRVGEGWIAALLNEPWPPQTAVGGAGVWLFQWGGDLTAQDDDWWVDYGVEYGVSGTKEIVEAATDPHYFVEYRSFVPDSLNQEGYGPGPGNTYYRVSARGHGATARSAALFQSHYTVRWN